MPTLYSKKILQPGLNLKVKNKYVMVTQKGFIMHGNDIFIEISEQLQQGKGCIVFDFGLYFPYRLNENDKLIYKFQLGMEELHDVKLNHRYPNKQYYTITKTYGRKLSKCGYPYFFDLKEKEPFYALLNLTTGLVISGEEDYFNMIFPLEVQLTTERPVCGLSLRQNFDEGRIEFVSNKSDENGYGWIPHYWSNVLLKEKGIDVTLLETPHKIGEKNIIFDTTIRPFAEKANNLLL